MDAKIESNLNTISQILGIENEMNLSFEPMKLFEDLMNDKIEPCYNHEINFNEENEPNFAIEKDLNALLPEQDENLDNIHIEVKSGTNMDNIDLGLHDEELEVDISPAWLHDHLNSVRWKIEEKNASEDVQNQNTAITQLNDEDSGLPKDMIVKLEKSKKDQTKDEAEDEDSHSFDSSNEHFINSSNKVRIVESCCKWNKADIEQVVAVPLVTTTKTKNTHKSSAISKRRRRRGGRNKTIENRNKEESDELENEFKMCSPNSKLMRKRTKLKSSGESSSSEPMDLSKRRDVVNKTILRVVRRYFSSTFKASLDIKYGNVLETQNR